MNEETLSLDSIFSNDLRLFQRRHGYRFSVDALLLAWFVAKKEIKSRKLALELGAGNGVVSLLLAFRKTVERIDCVERHEGLFNLLERNIAANGFSKSLVPIHGDLRYLDLPREQYDLVFFNPPYHPHSAGRPGPLGERAAARHELFGDLHDFLSCGAAALKKRGALYFVHPASRIAYACSAVSAARLAISHLTFVQERPSLTPALCLYRCIRGTVKTIETLLETVVMRNTEGTPTAAAAEILYALPIEKRGQGN